MAGFAEAEPIRARLRLLDPWTRREVLRRSLRWGVQYGTAELGAHGFGTLSQDAVTGVIGAAVQRALEPLLPTLGAQLMSVVEPAARKAADVVGPVLEEKLQKYGPIIGIIAGVVAAVLSIIGMVVVGGYVAKRVG